MISSQGDADLIKNEDAAFMAQKITGQVAAYLKENPKKAATTVALLEDIFQLSSQEI